MQGKAMQCRVKAALCLVRERDEVIVVDCGSSDTTATLAIELGAQVGS